MAAHRISWTLLVASLCGLVLGPIHAEDVVPASRKRTASLDVELSAEGVLAGELRDRQGRVQPLQDVWLWQKTRRVGRTRSDQRGRFQFRGVRGGVYRVVTGDVAVWCRCWPKATSPPAARAGLLLVTSDISTRGQQPLKEVFVANPFVMGGIIAAAIAIPIAVHNSGDDDQLPDGS